MNQPTLQVRRAGYVSIAAALLLAHAGFSFALAQDYPNRPIRMIVPFAEGDASGLVSRRPVRGKDAQAAGFYSVAMKVPESYPTKPVRLIVPFAPGGGTDIVARLVAQRLSESIRQSVVVDNRAGGAGNIGAELVARATPDGYTLLVGSATILAVNPIIFKVAYNPSRDFAPITLLGSQPHLMVLHPSVPANSVREFVNLAKEKSIRLNYGSSGTGGPAHLGGELFKIVAGIDMLHIPYKGTGPAVIDLVGGQLQVGLLSLASSMPHVKTGRLRALAVTSPKRAVVAPDLPTIAESGYPGFEVRSWYGLLAPAGTPRAIVDKLSSQIASVLRQPEVIAKLASDGAEPGGDTPAQFAAYIRSEAERWGKVVKSAGIRAD